MRLVNSTASRHSRDASGDAINRCPMPELNIILACVAIALLAGFVRNVAVHPVIMMRRGYRVVCTRKCAYYTENLQHSGRLL